MAKLLDLQGLQAMGKGIRSEGDCALRGFKTKEGNGREGGGKFSLPGAMMGVRGNRAGILSQTTQDR